MQKLWYEKKTYKTATMPACLLEIIHSLLIYTKNSYSNIDMYSDFLLLHGCISFVINYLIIRFSHFPYFLQFYKSEIHTHTHKSLRHYLIVSIDFSNCTCFIIIFNFIICLIFLLFLSAYECKRAKAAIWSIETFR